MSTQLSCILRGCAPLVSGVFLSAQFLSAMPEVIEQSRGLRPLSYEVQFWGRTEGGYKGRASSGLGAMQPAGSMREVLPGLYQFTDGDTAFHGSRIYQIHKGDAGPLPGWADIYPVAPGAGGEAGPLPSFEWQPYPAPPHEVMYELRVYEFETGPRSGRIRVWDGMAPVLMAGGLMEARYQFGFEDPVLQPDKLYAYQVNAILLSQGQIIAGRAVPFRGFMAPANTVDWNNLFALLREMLEELENLQKELDDNSLIQEAKLIEQLLAILQDDEKLREFVVAILEGEWEKLKEKILSTETLVKVLHQLVKLIDYFLAYDRDLTDAQREALEILKNRLLELIEAIKGGQSLADAWAELQALIEEIKEIISDPAAYLVEQIKEKLIEKLTEHLAKHLGSKAAGALVSILVDLIAAGDALITAYEISALEEKINKLLIDAINAESRTVEASRVVGWPTREGDEDCLVTLSYKKVCFKRSEGGGEHEGTWEVHPVPLEGGGNSATSRVGDLPVENGRRQFEVKLDPAALRCPPGEGPCLVYLEFLIECPNGKRRSHTVFVGVIKC